MNNPKPCLNIVSLESIPEGKIHSFNSSNVEFFTIIVPYKALSFEIDKKEYRINGKKIVFIGPYKKINILGTKNLKGFILVFSRKFYEISRTDVQILNSEVFYGSDEFVESGVSIFGYDHFHELSIQILEEADLVSQESMFRSIVRNRLETLILEGLSSLRAQVASSEAEEEAQDKSIAGAFHMLVNKHYREQISVSWYAEQLSLGTRRLSEITLAVLGKTAKTVIIDIVLKEAIRSITHSDLTISQISHEMGFSEESNFRRFIKKHTGKTPLTFRHRESVKANKMVRPNQVKSKKPFTKLQLYGVG